jgi:hypothetical protein
MYKKLVLAAALLTTSLTSQAAFIPVVTGADMAGIEVTVTYDLGPSETLTWQVVNAGNGLTDTVSLETYMGGVSSNNFSLTQQGDSQGNVDTKGTIGLSDDVFYGLWTLTNTSQSSITSLFVNGLGGNIVFDIEFDNLILNGSDVGRFFAADPSGTSASGSYTANYQDELYSEMYVELLLGSGQSLDFFADTDSIAVSTPTTISILMLSLFGFVMNARRKLA